MLRQADTSCSTTELGEEHGDIWSLGADASAAYGSERPIFWLSGILKSEYLPARGAR